jgi:hypothetical protein
MSVFDDSQFVSEPTPYQKVLIFLCYATQMQILLGYTVSLF